MSVNRFWHAECLFHVEYNVLFLRRNWVHSYKFFSRQNRLSSLAVNLLKNSYHQRTYVPKLSTYLLIYIHTYFTTYVPTSLRTFVPTYLYYLCTTIVPTYLNYLHAYLLMYLHTYQPYLTTYVAESRLIAWSYMFEQMVDRTKRSSKIMASLHLPTSLTSSTYLAIAYAGTTA